MIDEYLWKVKKYLIAKYGTFQADREAEPLEWYILYRKGFGGVSGASTCEKTVLCGATTT